MFALSQVVQSPIGFLALAALGALLIGLGYFTVQCLLSSEENEL